MNRIGVLVDTAFFEDMTAFDNLEILMLSTPHRDNSNRKRDIMGLLRLGHKKPCSCHEDLLGHSLRDPAHQV